MQMQRQLQASFLCWVFGRYSVFAVLGISGCCIEGRIWDVLISKWLGPMCFPNNDYVLTKRLKGTVLFEVVDSDLMTRFRYCPLFCETQR